MEAVFCFVLSDGGPRFSCVCVIPCDWCMYIVMLSVWQLGYGSKCWVLPRTTYCGNGSIALLLYPVLKFLSVSLWAAKYEVFDK